MGPAIARPAPATPSLHAERTHLCGCTAGLACAVTQLAKGVVTHAANGAISVQGAVMDITNCGLLYSAGKAKVQGITTTPEEAASIKNQATCVSPGSPRQWLVTPRQQWLVTPSSFCGVGWGPQKWLLPSLLRLGRHASPGQPSGVTWWGNNSSEPHGMTAGVGAGPHSECIP